MLPAIKGISDDPAYKDNDIRKKFQHAEEVITKAAEKLFIAQPSLTQSLHRIEEDYGASFFYRCHDGVRLTEAGENYMLQPIKCWKLMKN